MFKITSNNVGHLTVECSCKMGKEDMKLVLDELTEKSKSMETGRILYRTNDSEPPALGAMGIELFRQSEFLKLAKKIDRAAIMTNRQWVGQIGELEGLLIPGLQIKAFAVTDEDQAETWLSE